SELTNYSPGTLAKAASGDSLPSLEVTLAYVNACNGDIQRWKQEWELARASLQKNQARHATEMPHPSEPGTEESLSSQWPPAQLPPMPALFMGRNDQLNELDALLGNGTHTASPSFAVVSGPPGAGKTALAIKWAHRARKDFPDGQLFIDLRGFSHKKDPMTP